MQNSVYKDRIEAGFTLAKELARYKNSPGVVLAVPRGGVPVAYVVARELGLPMEVILSKKIGHPLSKEYAIGAVSLNGSFIEPHEDVPETYIKMESARIRNRLNEMRKKFMNNKTPQDITGKTVIVIDDGVATGNTLLATINIIRKNNPAKIVLAVPVASSQAFQKLCAAADEVVCPLVPEFFYAIGEFYENFSQVQDEDVIYYLEKLNLESHK